MLSIKNIDLLNIQIKDKDVYYGPDLLIIKSPFVNATNNSEEELNLINMQLDYSIRSHSRLKEILLYIKRKYSEFGINFNIDVCLNLIIDSDTLFFDSNQDKISKNAFNKESRAICSFYIKEGFTYLHQCMKV
jgi:hypothetical protein